MKTLFGLGKIAENDASLVRGSADECARHLLRYLSHHGFIERGLGGAQERASEGVAASSPAKGRQERSATDAASIPIRARRRPRPVDYRPLSMRGPFEVGVDI
jgi:hypothetical protein